MIFFKISDKNLKMPIVFFLILFTKYFIEEKNHKANDAYDELKEQNDDLKYFKDEMFQMRQPDQELLSIFNDENNIVDRAYQEGDSEDDESNVLVQNIKDIPPQIIGIEPTYCLTGNVNFKVFVKEVTWLTGICRFDSGTSTALISDFQSYTCSYNFRKEGKYNVSFSQNSSSSEWIHVGIVNVNGRGDHFPLVFAFVIVGSFIGIFIIIFFVLKKLQQQKLKNTLLPY